MRKPPVVITELPPSPADEQAGRFRRYAIMMSIRTVCVVACIFTPGWWLLIPALGAVFLPYVAVVLANAVGVGRRTRIDRPDAIVPRRPR